MALIDQDIGRQLQLDGFVVAAVPAAGGIAFATGAGTLWLADMVHAVHDGAILCACAAPDGQGVLTGGDDGALRLTRADASCETLLAGSRWIDAVAASAASGLIAAAAGKQVHVMTAQGPVGVFNHASSVSGLAFDPKGKRLAASHYGGVSLWWAANPTALPVSLAWKGSHIGLTWSPDGRFVVTAMQEASLHGWRVADKADMRMTGYPAKTRSLAWSPRGRWLLTSGAPSVICWPFQGRDGPMGKPPLELPGYGPLITAVASHPTQEIVAAGHQDGSLCLLRLADEAELPAASAADAPVSAVAFNADGKTLGFGREDGSAGLILLP